MSTDALEPYLAIRDHFSIHAPETAASIAVLSVPHWWDDDLGRDLVERFTNSNGSTSFVLSEVKRLPFVVPYERRGWRIADKARAVFLRQDDPLVADVDAY